MPYSYTGYTVFLASEKGYFKNNGLDVTLKSYQNGGETLKAVGDGETQFGVSSETPFVHSVSTGEKLFAIAVTVTADRHVAVIARKDRGISVPEDLRGKTIGVTIGSNGEYFLDIVLRLCGLSGKDINAVDVSPDRMFDKIIDGEVDAIATWNPQKQRTLMALGENGAAFNAEGLYSPSFLIAARQDYVHANPKTVERFVRSLKQASDYIRESPVKAREIVANRIKTDASLLHELTATYRFRLSLDQFFLTTLENQADWMAKNKLKSPVSPPDFLDSIYPDALDAVEPENVTIIR